MPLSCKIILSHHDYEETPSDEVLEALVSVMYKDGADIAKVATTAQTIQDSARLLALPGKASGQIRHHITLLQWGMQKLGVACIPRQGCDRY